MAPNGTTNAKGEPLKLPLVVSADGSKVYALSIGASMKDGERLAGPAELLAVSPGAVIEGFTKSPAV